ncbi:MAG: SHOCT domain-containing protein, partial [Nakamurella sp.]
MLAPLTPAGEATIAELAQRYRVSDDAVRGLLDGVICGGGTMAQFSHPDLGGSGQWMRGGMTMVGDMFNPGLQATVSGICSELATQVAAGAVLISSPEGASAGSGALTGFGGGDSWWPAELGRPSSSGVQNDAAYAYFPVPRLLAIRRGQKVTVHDTGDHAISGVQQQQGGRGSLEFTSQLGSFT